MEFYSILFRTAESLKDTNSMPDFLADLNLDQLIDAVIKNKDGYDIKPFFYVLLNSIDGIKYRQNIMKDLENKSVSEYIDSFAHNMIDVREFIEKSEKSYYKYHKERLLLNAAAAYCGSINSLSRNLSSITLSSEGFLSFRKYLSKYIKSDKFISLSKKIETLIYDLSQIRYNLLIKGNSVTVSKYDNEIDLGDRIQKIFKKFQRGSVKDYTIKFPASNDINHIEAQILEKVSGLYPEVFSRLDEFCEQNNHFQDNLIIKFDTEIQFYTAFLEYIEQFKQKGLHFCHPQISNTDKGIYAYAAFDLSLASKLLDGSRPIVCNDFSLQNSERIFVVTGPNQGGKTTFSRIFGQLHYLSKMGLSVPAEKAKLFLFDKLFTHFEREENILDLRGKLEDDLVRIKEIVNQATPNSIIIMNEIFNSTTFSDAVFLSKKIMEKIVRLDLLCVWVTFIDELSILDDKIVSMVAAVMPDNPSQRTYKIVRKPSDGISYAMSIALKYRLTYKDIKERITE